MSLLHCPACDHPIGRLTPSATREMGLDRAVVDRVGDWLKGAPWAGRKPTSDAFAEYVSATGDRVTSHRQFSRAVQACGVAKVKGAKGVRIFVR